MYQDMYQLISIYLIKKLILIEKYVVNNNSGNHVLNVALVSPEI